MELGFIKNLTNYSRTVKFHFKPGSLHTRHNAPYIFFLNFVLAKNNILNDLFFPCSSMCVRLYHIWYHSVTGNDLPGSFIAYGYQDNITMFCLFVVPQQGTLLQNDSRTTSPAPTPQYESEWRPRCLPFILSSLFFKNFCLARGEECVQFSPLCYDGWYCLSTWQGLESPERNSLPRLWGII